MVEHQWTVGVRDGAGEEYRIMVYGKDQGGARWAAEAVARLQGLTLLRAPERR